MATKHKEMFEANSGYRFYKDKQSLVWMMGALGKPFNEQERYAFALAIAGYLHGVGHRIAVPSEFRPSVTVKEFPDRKAQPMLKFISHERWDKYLSKGRIQLGSCAYYRHTEEMEICDGNEGLSFTSLTSKDRAFHFFLETGANMALFCGTHHGNTSQAEMKKRFGDILIEIDTQPFAEHVASLIGASEYKVHDVVYTDAKTFHADEDFDAVEEILGKLPPPKDLTGDAIHQINEKFFDVFYRIGLYPSIFCKPATRYALEQERRIVFIMPSDLTDNVVQVEDASLLKHIKVLAKA